MSELMDKAVINMPYDMAMSDELSRRQFYSRAQCLMKERDAYRDLCVELREVLHSHYWDDCSNYSGNIERLLKKAEQLLGEKK